MSQEVSLRTLARLRRATNLMAPAVRDRGNRSKVSVTSPRIASGIGLQTSGKDSLSTAFGV